MKVVVIRHSIRNRGGDKLVLDYAAYLAERGADITYWTNEVNTTFPIHPRICIKKIPAPGILGTILFALTQKFHADIVLVDLVVMAAFASLRNRKNVLYLAQDYDVSYHRSGVLKWFIDTCYRTILHALGTPTISVSDGLTKTLQRYEPKRLITVSNGVDLEKFYREEKSMFSQKRERSFVILLFARNDYRKGLDVGIAALESLRVMVDPSQWEVWVIGSDPIKIEGVTVKHFGFLDSDEKMRALLSAVDIYLVPSRSEGLSLLLLQALACECVVVSTRTSFIIEHEVNGLVSSIEDALGLARNLSRVIHDQELRGRLQRHARELASRFSFQESCRQFEKVLCDWFVIR